MERQLVAPSVDQWRAVRRSITTQETTYKPGPEFFGYRPRNRQLLHITSSEPNDQGFYPAKWVQSDVGDQTHNDQNDVWAWPVDGVASEDQYLEGDNVGELDGVPVFRGFIANGNQYPDLLYLVTNVCPIGETKSLSFTAGVDVVVDSEDMTVIASGTYTAPKGTAKVKCVVIWEDPDFLASTGDSFGFLLRVGTDDYIGAPEYFVTAIGWGVTKTVEMTWDVAFPAAGDYTLFLLGYRVSGSAEITADENSRIELDGAADGIRVEYTPVALPSVIKGTKVCIDNPQNCCVDDDSSGTASRDTASRSPFPLLYSQGDSPTCIDSMGYRGTDYGVFGDTPVYIARRYKLTLPTFEPYAFTDSWGNAIPACDQSLADHLSGRVIVLETASGPGLIGPEEGKAWEVDAQSFYNPEGVEGATGGTCGYGVNWTGPTLQYTLPNGNTANWGTGSFAQIGVTWNNPAITQKLVIPRRVVFALRGISYGLTMRAYSTTFRDDFFFDTAITLQIINTPGYVAYAGTSYPAGGIRTLATSITLEPF